MTDGWRPINLISKTLDLLCHTSRNRTSKITLSQSDTENRPEVSQRSSLERSVSFFQGFDGDVVVEDDAPEWERMEMPIIAGYPGSCSANCPEGQWSAFSRLLTNTRLENMSSRIFRTIALSWYISNMRDTGDHFSNITGRWLSISTKRENINAAFDVR